MPTTQKNQPRITLTCLGVVAATKTDNTDRKVSVARVPASAGPLRAETHSISVTSVSSVVPPEADPPEEERFLFFIAVPDS